MILFLALLAAIAVRDGAAQSSATLTPSTITASPSRTTLQVFNFGGGTNDIEATSVSVPLLGSIVAADACHTTIAIGYGSNSTAVSYHFGQLINVTNVVSSVKIRIKKDALT
jgi:hypothetical protein